jgi:hypothetical protein
VKELQLTDQDRQQLRQAAEAIEQQAAAIQSAARRIRDLVAADEPPPAPAPPPPDGSTIAVKAGEDLQRALAAARPGATIVLEAGATFSGNFTLARNAGGALITIRSAPGAKAKLVAKDLFQPILEAPSGASHYRLENLILQAPGAMVELVRLGSGTATSASEQPENITLAGCEIYAHPSAGSRRGISLQARHVTLDGCVIRGFKADVEAQAIACWNGPGPYRIANCSLSAAGEVIIFGGSDAKTPGLNPNDIYPNFRSCGDAVTFLGGLEGHPSGRTKPRPFVSNAARGWPVGKRPKR